jgi:hypothetical protein
MKRHRDVMRGNECDKIRDYNPAAVTENSDNDHPVQNFLLKSNKHEHKHSKSLTRHN